MLLSELYRFNKKADNEFNIIHILHNIMYINLNRVVVQLFSDYY